MPTDYEDVRQALKGKDLNAIASRTAVSYATLLKLREGRTARPQRLTLILVRRYFGLPDPDAPRARPIVKVSELPLKVSGQGPIQVGQHRSPTERDTMRITDYAFAPDRKATIVSEVQVSEAPIGQRRDHVDLTLLFSPGQRVTYPVIIDGRKVATDLTGASVLLTREEAITLARLLLTLATDLAGVDTGGRV